MSNNWRNIVFLVSFLEFTNNNLFYFILIFCIQITSSFQLFYLIYVFLQYFFRYFFFIFFIVFLSYSLEVQTYNFFFYLEILYLDRKPFLAILLDLSFCPIFFEILILFDGLVCFKMFSNVFFKKYGLSPLFLLIFVVSFSFLKSVESISLLKKFPGILFFFSFFGGTNV